jgi:hypothetical protein
MLKRIVNIFSKKKNKMSFENKSLEELELDFKNSNFQWIKGENLGTVERFESVSQEGQMKFLNFQGGGRINLEILREYIDVFPAPPVQFDAVPPPASQTIPQPERGKVTSVNYGSPVSGVEESPIYKLLRKQKANWVNVNISLKLNLPTKSLYNVLISSFEDAESEIANYVTEGVDIEDIKEAIAESIKTSFYETKKNLNQRTKSKEINEDELSED